MTYATKKYVKSARVFTRKQKKISLFDYALVKTKVRKFPFNFQYKIKKKDMTQNAPPPPHTHSTRSILS